jgi:hypothetical protein
MRHWTFWEWVAYGCLLVGAIIVAAETGFKTEPEVMAHLPDFFRSPIWGFAPVFLMISATVILFLREFVFPRAVSSHVVATRDHALHGRIDLPVTESYYIGDAIIANQMPALPRLIGTVTRNETRLRIILCNLDWRGRLVQTSATAT